MQALLAARLEFEMLHRIGDIGLAAIDAGIGQSAVEEFSCRPNKGPALQVFLIARLLTDKDDRRLRGTLAEDGLGRVFVERAAAAILGLGAQLHDRPALGTRFCRVGNFRHDKITPLRAICARSGVAELAWCR